MSHCWKIIFLCLLCSWPQLGQSLAAAEREPGLVRKIPYLEDGKLIYLRVRVNGAQPEWFCLDSGAPHSVIDPRLSARLGLRTVTTGQITGAGKGAVRAANLEPVTLDVEGVKVRAAQPYGIDLSKVDFRKNTLGLLGFEAFEQYVLRLDPRAHEISFFDPRKFVPRAGEKAIPLIAMRNKLYLDAKIDVRPGLQVVHRLRIDLGSGDAVNDPIVGKASVTGRTKLGGLGEYFQGISGIYDAVQIGPYRFHHVWGPGATQPTIGMEVFRRFVSTFDVRRGALHLVPTPALSEPFPAPTILPAPRKTSQRRKS